MRKLLRIAAQVAEAILAMVMALLDGEHAIALMDTPQLPGYPGLRI